MFRTSCAIALATMMAVSLLSAATASAADEKRPTAIQWDDGGPITGAFQVALRDGDDNGPPGPPRDGDDRRPPPPTPFERNPDAAGRGRQPPPPPRGGDERSPYGTTERGGGRGGPPSGGPGRMAPRFSPFETELQRRDPEMYKLVEEDRQLERQSRELAMQYRGAPSEDREKIKQQLVDLVNKHFDVRQQRRTLELKRLEEQLQRLREAIDKRAKARSILVETRVSQLIGHEDEVGF